MTTSQSAETASLRGAGTEPWRSEIGFLGSLLGETIRTYAGRDAFALVEKVRRLSWLRRTGDTEADAQLKHLFAGLDDEQVRMVTRAFTIFLDLLNLVEDRRRIQVLRQRAEAALPAAPAESIGQAFAQLKSQGVSAEVAEKLLNALNIELVFTAHPTEAKRRSVRRKLSEIRRLTTAFHEEAFAHRRRFIEDDILRELAILWQTDFIRPWRPSVMQEVQRGLSIKSVLWHTVPEISREISKAAAEQYGDDVTLRSPPIEFGSWIGGDRDGHPGVTADVTATTLKWLHREAIEYHLNTCRELFDTFTLSSRQATVGVEVQRALKDAVNEFPELEDQIAAVPPGEICRRYLAVICWRLQQTHQALVADSGATPSQAVYTHPDQLQTDLQCLIGSVIPIAGSSRVLEPLRVWREQISTFGFHLAKLDVRQNSSVYRKVVNELLRSSGRCDAPESLSESDRCDALSGKVPKFLTGDLFAGQSYSDETIEVLRLFSGLHRHAAASGADSIGAQIVSMTSVPSDILSVLWLWEATRLDDHPQSAEPPIVPLLETIEDLRNGPTILESLLSTDGYRQRLVRTGNRQMIMLGYSDSTKDGGYLSACWALHECQRTLSNIADKHGISVTYFHGRGGSLGRGGGPAARSILSLPRGSFDGSIRITEQGEVLAERYDDPEIAHRHLEQMVWSSLLATGSDSPQPDATWAETMSKVATESRRAYRELVEADSFVAFFRAATPISEIEQLPIGSRPSRRKPDGGLDDLRAIPWVFSWTQCRCLLPAWFGMGSACDALEQNDHSVLRDMYRRWPFFRATMDNAELALAKADPGIMNEYFALTDGDDGQGDHHGTRQIAKQIQDEYVRSREALLSITGNTDLLSGTPWLRESIRVRNRFIDPLNLLQVELMRRKQRDGLDDDEEHRHLLRLTVNGIASGMRTSG
ncbi:MAG: phosphoenolpyruvate carboxylase [Planctomycetota bacterium]